MAINLTRRNFLKTASLAAASVPLSKVIAHAEKGVTKTPLIPQGSFKDTKTVTGGICEMCFWRCQLVGKVRDGVLMKLEGNPKSIDNGTALCARGNAGIKLLYDPDRLKYPMKNVGKRGAPKWKRISWEEALDECGKKLKATVDEHGPQGIAMFPHGASAKYPMHYFEHVVGTPNVSEASFFQCRGVRDYAWLSTIGTGPGEHMDMANAKVIFALGCHFGEAVHVSHMKRYLKGLENGAKLVIVDPRFSASASKAHIWMQIKPGTDTAMVLAMMNYLVQNKKYNADYVDEYGEGFDEFKEAISGWTLDKAAKECEVPAAQIKEIAELLAANAPNVSIHPGRFNSWYGNDFQRGRALACLAGLLGAYGVPGGFVKGKGPGGFGKVKWGHGHGDHEEVEAMHREAEIYHQSPAGTPTDLIRDCAITGNPYPIKSCVVWGQNPIQTIPNQQKTIDMLMQMDFVMCVDVMPTDITMYADILLPEASYMERYDYIKKGTQWDLSAKQQQYISARMPLVKAEFERKDQVYICNELAKRMGNEKAIPVQTLEEMVNKILQPAGLSIKKLIEEDGIHLQPGKDPYGDFKDVVFYSEDLVDEGYSGAPTYVPVPEVPNGYLRLLFGRSPLHSFNRTQNNAWLHAAMPENPVWVNDKTAKQLGLKDGDRISLVNSESVESGTTSHVMVTPGIRQDCVFMAHGYGTKNAAMTVAKDAGIDDQKLITILAVDPETGCHGMRNNFVKIVKA